MIMKDLQCTIIPWMACVVCSEAFLWSTIIEWLSKQKHVKANTLSGGTLAHLVLSMNSCLQIRGWWSKFRVPCSKLGSFACWPSSQWDHIRWNSDNIRNVPLHCRSIAQWDSQLRCSWDIWVVPLCLLPTPTVDQQLCQGLLSNTNQERWGTECSKTQWNAMVVSRRIRPRSSLEAQKVTSQK